MTNAVDPAVGELLWLLRAAPKQCAYVIAKVQFDLIDAERDRLLAPIDRGERTTLSEVERERLESLNRQLAAAYNAVLVAEQNLRIWARAQDELRR